MKLKTTITIFVGMLLMASCVSKDAKNNDTNLVVGGLYLAQDDDGTYGVSKILALEDQGVHVRLYSDKFETKPTDLNSADLKFIIGHVPIGKEGFISSKPELLKVEKVTDEELEGYNYYLEAMKGQ